MNASVSITATTLVPTVRAEHFGKTLLLVNGIVLGTIALLQVLFDLAGYFLDLGPNAAALFQNADAIGYLEAHGLALLIAIILVVHHRRDGATWNWIAAATHLLLGVANVLFWPAFASYGIETLGVVATALHAGFFALQVIAAFARTPDAAVGPGAAFRWSMLITLGMGAVLHGASLPLGREAFVETLFTPTFDAIFAIPMTAAAILGWVLYRRAIFPATWRRVVYIATMAHFTLSVVIRARTLITWDTSYVLAFPSWYSLPILVLFGALAVFTLQQRFQPKGNV